MFRILIIWFMCLPVFCVAQGIDIRENAHFIVNREAYIVVQDGHLTNNGNFTSDASIVLFIGNANSSDMQISGDSLTSFHQLVINKTTNGIQLGADIEIDDSLKMVSGDLDMNGFDINLGSSGSIYGESNTNRIWGTAGGEISYTTTINAPSSYRPANLGIELTSSQSFGMTTIKRGHARKTSDTGYGIYRYFDISPTNNSNLDATFVYHYFENELGGIIESELDLWRYDGSVWESQGAVLNTTTNTLTKTGIPAFSIWTAGSTINNPLPVELLYFRSDCAERGIQLSWATATETNSDYFTIARSIDGENWEEVSQITSSGNSHVQVDYQYIDVEGNADLYYYRLAQTDIDGTKETFNVIQANCQQEIADFSIHAFPNPTQGSINLEVESNNTEPIYYAWYTIHGQALGKGSCEPNKLNQLQLDVLASGVYILMVVQGKESKTIKVMKR